LQGWFECFLPQNDYHFILALLLQDLIDLQLSLIVVEFHRWERFELLYFSQGGWVDYWG
jgi:hypothetical protein